MLRIKSDHYLFSVCHYPVHQVHDFCLHAAWMTFVHLRHVTFLVTPPCIVEQHLCNPRCYLVQDLTGRWCVSSWKYWVHAKNQQRSDIINYSGAVTFFKSHHNQFTESALNCQKEHLTSHNTKFGYCSYAALQSLTTRFQVPLDKANVDSSLLQDERDSIVLNVTEENNSVWWKQFCQCKRLADSCRIAFLPPYVCLMATWSECFPSWRSLKQTDRNVWGKTDWTIYSALLHTSAPALCDWVQKISTPKKHLCIPPLQYVSFDFLSINRGPFKWER